MNKVKTHIDSLLNLNEVLSIEVFFDADGTSVYYAGVFAKRGEDILASSDVQKFNSLQSVLDSFPKSKTIVLTVSGKGVLFKSVEGDQSENDLVKKAFPQINTDDFHTQINPTQDGYMVSIVRISQLEELFNNEAIDQGAIALNIGVASHAVFFQQDVEIGSYQLSYSNKTLTSIKSNSTYSTSSIQLFDEELKATNAIVHLSAALSLLKAYPVYHSKSEEFSKKLNQQVEQKLIKSGGLVALAFTLVLVLSNFFVFSSLSKTHNELASQKMMVESDMREFKEQQKMRLERQELFDKLNFREESRHAELADKIAASSNSKIQFTSINIYPELGSQQVNKTVEFNKKAVIITGRAKNSSGFKKFTSQLDDLNILNQVTMKQFSKNEKYNAYDFKILALLNE